MEELLRFSGLNNSDYIAENAKEPFSTIETEITNTFAAIDMCEMFEYLKSQYYHDYENGKNIQCRVVLNELIDGNFCQIDEYDYKIYKNNKEWEQITTKQINELVGEQWDYEEVICAFYTDKQVIVEKSENLGYDYIAYINEPFGVQYLFNIDKNEVITDIWTYEY